MVSQVGKIRAIFLAVVLAVVASFAGLTNQASADTTTQLNATQIVAEMGAGWNLGNQMEANSNGYPSETAWGQPIITQALIDKVKSAGFKTIRIPVSYLRHIGPGPDYTINAAWLNRIQEVVNYAYNRGLYVLINMHGDGYKTIYGSWLICDSSNQTAIRAKYQKVWQQIATRFQNYDQRLILESMNENFDGQFGRPTQPCYSNINSYNQIFVDTVRRTGGNNGSRWLLVPGWNTNIEYTAGNYGFVLPTDQYRSPSIPSNEQRIMISVHHYDPWDFAGEESGTITQWGRAATNPSKTSTWGQEDYLDAQLKKMYDKFVVRGYPVVVGEYGAIDKSSFDSSNPRYRADYMRAVASTAKKYGAAPVYWDNGETGRYGFGLFNRHSHAVTQQGIIDAIMSGVGGGGGSPGLPSATYKIRNVSTGKYLDSDANGAITLAAAGSYDDQDWVVTQHSSGAWTIRNARTGRFYADSETNSAVIWNSGEVTPDSLWRLESASGGFRLNNEQPDRHFMYGTSAGEVKWNTGSTDSSTIWSFERK
ncbi:cellulase family glycosylhydrolase [Streptomyces azureus]|uniref:Cellulase n=1 Tax=Streptomyces azureus TaxID=146537 RepID=A0A0K8PKJ0_STRAJ|nr:cellulase family glycosylhydrolase [Streptomyces azureus]GAP48400.1 cellulase [Streptomyces azureus]